MKNIVFTKSHTIKTLPIMEGITRNNLIDQVIRSGITRVIISSVAENPSFENSSCKADTWEALNLVELPSSRAFSFSFLNSPAVAPETAFTFAIDCSKSAATLNEATAISPSGAVTFLVRLAPLLFRLLDVLRMERWAFCRPFSKPSALRSRRTLRRDCLAISSGIQFDQWWVLCSVFLLHMG